MNDLDAPAAGNPERTGGPGTFTGATAAVAGFVLQQALIVATWNVLHPGLALALGGALGVCLPAWAWCRWMHASLRATLRLRPLSRTQWVTVVGFAAALLVLVYAVNARWQQVVPPAPALLEFYAALVPTGPGSATAGVLGIVVLGPCAEEWIFRGLLQPALVRWLRPGAAIPAVAILFAAAHVSWAFFPSLLLLGLGLGVVAWWTRSTHAAWAVHAVANGVAYADLCLTRTPETPELDRWASHPLLLAAAMLGLAATGWFLSTRERGSTPGAARGFAPAPFADPPDRRFESKSGDAKDGNAGSTEP